MDDLPLSILFTVLNVTDTISLPKLFLTIFLVLLNGFFVAAEFAIVKVRSSQIVVESSQSPRKAKAAKTIVNNLDSYLAATQLGITLASLGLGWVGESSLTPVIYKTFTFIGFIGNEYAEIARKISFPIAFIIITMLHIVFGELAPKSLAIQFPTKTTFAVAWPLKLFYAVFKPVIFIMNGLASIILKIFGIRPIHGSDIHTEEELKMIISESQEGGAIKETERELIQNVFDFDNRRVGYIMMPKKNVSAINIDSPIEEIIKYTLAEGYSRYPVYEHSIENIKGILYTKDLFKAYTSYQKNLKIKEILRIPLFVSETALIKNVLKTFQQKHSQLAIVTNELGEFSGLVTLEDILEELVGEIQDEYDNEEPIVVNVSKDIYIVNSHNKISDINKFIPYPFEENEHYETLAGYISEKYNERELKVNDIIDLDEYKGKILKMYRNSVESIQLKIIEDLNNDSNTTEAG
ncbi:HlyC/CorC family transporter [Apibacter muscae]|uniref:HlyC/CorC family transporter n=1 Tax=Apibacter muscae TaxID=2509004 RepID=A0A563D9T2_9FLAO|nr:hemolysin family protein [Apibacter muscae]TWP26544.1 HlyC/CorC family transporter [Apibacter muscae]TWP28118.1 HlyC/CorC family transporter [Apibacter muscae]